jgi:cbb3-type cytochrome oxidase maturation protein
MMNILVYLIPISLLLGGFGLGFFLWSMETHQFDDPDGSAARILRPDWDSKPPMPLD